MRENASPHNQTGTVSRRNVEVTNIPFELLKSQDILNFMIFDQKAARYNWIDYLYLVRAKWPVVALAASLLLLVGAGLRWRQDPLREVSASLAVERETRTPTVRRASTEVRPATSTGAERYGDRLAEAERLLEVVETCELVDRWQLANRGEALARLEERVRVEPGEEEGVLVLSVRDSSARTAASVANALAQRFVDDRREAARGEIESRVRLLTAEADSTRETVERLEKRITEPKEGSEEGTSSDAVDFGRLRERLANEKHLLRTLEAKRQLAARELGEIEPDASLVREASAERATVVSSKARTLALWGALGAALGVVIVGAGSLGRSGVAVASRLGERLRLEVVGFAPIAPKPLFRLRRPAGSLVEPYRELRLKLHRLPAADSSVLTFVPAGRDARLAEVVANLGSVVADGGHTTLVIDADFRGARLHELFDAGRRPGLSDYLAGEMRLEETVVRTGRPNLWFLPAGPLGDDPCGLVSGKRMDDLVRHVRERFDSVLVAGPSIFEISDAAVLASHADHTVAVTAYRGHSATLLDRARTAIEAAGATLSAVVLSRELRPNVAGESQRGTDLESSGYGDVSAGRS